MKGFLIFMALVVGGSIYFFTHTAELAAQVLASIEQEEQPDAPAFQELMYKDADQFALHYRPFLEKRARLGKWLDNLGEKAPFLALAQRTRDLYHDSSLASDPSYGDLLWRSAVILDNEGNGFSAQESLTLCRQYQALLPEGAHKDEISSIANSIQTHYNFK